MQATKDSRAAFLAKRLEVIRAAAVALGMDKHRDRFGVQYASAHDDWTHIALHVGDVNGHRAPLSTRAEVAQ